MGSWSESCGLSGIEIGVGEVASCQFARSILKIQKKRKKRWDDL